MTKARRGAPVKNKQMAVEILYFVRHGETDMNLEFRCQGRIDTELNARGREQMQAAAKDFEGVKIDKIYTSPLQRAALGAAAIAGPHGLVPEPAEWLLEINHGTFEGFNDEQAEAAIPGLMHEWRTNPHTVKFTGGESLEDVGRRVAAGLHGMCEKESGTVVMVTHQVVTGVARCILSGEPLSEVWKGKLLNGKHIRFEMNSESMEKLARFAGIK